MVGRRHRDADHWPCLPDELLGSCLIRSAKRLLRLGTFLCCFLPFLGWVAKVDAVGQRHVGQRAVSEICRSWRRGSSVSIPCCSPRLTLSGGVMGKMISPQNIATGVSVTKMAGQEGVVFARTFVHSIEGRGVRTHLRAQHRRAWCSHAPSCTASKGVVVAAPSCTASKGVFCTFVHSIVLTILLGLLVAVQQYLIPGIHPQHSVGAPSINPELPQQNDSEKDHRIPEQAGCRLLARRVISRQRRTLTCRFRNEADMELAGGDRVNPVENDPHRKWSVHRSSRDIVDAQCGGSDQARLILAKISDGIEIISSLIPPFPFNTGMRSGWRG